jgi:hypothetical protein
MGQSGLEPQAATPAYIETPRRPAEYGCERADGASLVRGAAVPFRVRRLWRGSSFGVPPLGGLWAAAPGRLQTA